MKLTDLDPRWLFKDIRPIGFIFISPKQGIRLDGTMNPIPWRQTCFVEPTPFSTQKLAVHTAMADISYDFDFWQGCNQSFAWTIIGGIESASFGNMSVTPSLDGSQGGLWHGKITNGEIVGGI